MKHCYKINLTNENIKNLYKYFGHASLGYYYQIIEILKKQDNYMYPKNKLNKLSRDLKISRKKLENFISICSKLNDINNMKIFSENEKYFWSYYILSEKNKISHQNKKRGRRKSEIKESIKLDSGELVNLTINQYKTLIYKYGEIFIQKAISILNEWLKLETKHSKKYLNKNNYAFFRKDGWVINTTFDYFTRKEQKNLT